MLTYLCKLLIFLIPLLSSLRHSEQELQSCCEKLEGQVQMLEEHLAKTQEDKQRQHNQHAQELERERWVKGTT